MITPPVELYLIRHGIAADRKNYGNDEERPLTDKGRRKTKKVAYQLHKLGKQFDLILTSPLVRARQTAEILQAAGLSSQIEESPWLAPDGNIYSWLGWLEKWRYDNGGSSHIPPYNRGDGQRAAFMQLALVGHQPDLGNWAEILVWGNAKEKLVLKKAGVIGLMLPEIGTPLGKSQLFLLAAPKWLL